MIEEALWDGLDGMDGWMGWLSQVIGSLRAPWVLIRLKIEFILDLL